jgi:hypothetical protein
MLKIKYRNKEGLKGRGLGFLLSIALAASWSCVASAYAYDRDVEEYNYILGTHAIDGKYKFTPEHPDLEAAREILKMGSTTVKLREFQGTVFETIVDLPFKNVFVWFGNRTVFKQYEDEVFSNGLTEEERLEAYQQMYDYVKYLLARFGGSGKTFYVGQWEGDWEMLMPKIDGTRDASPEAIDGAIAWLNTRQQAVDDAKRDTPHENIQIWHYAEVNRVRDAMDFGRARMINRVIPFVNVDFLSYSAYDCQNLAEAEVFKTLDYIQSQLKPKPEISGKRILVGEFGFRARGVNYSNKEHEKKNRDIILKFMRYGGLPFILYWDMYNNEYQNGIHEGYWLIDDKGVKWDLYYTFQKLYENGKKYVAAFKNDHGRLPTTDEYSRWASQYLTNLP